MAGEMGFGIFHCLEQDESEHSGDLRHSDGIAPGGSFTSS